MIAIVDDDEAVRVATRHLVQALGFETQAFASAEDLLKASPANEWSCVISDVNMPGLSGIELQRRLAAEGRSVPFVFITAFPDQAVQDRALKAGAAGFLTKPFASCDLIECLERALRGNDAPNQH
ncbi:response regulator transcription factor [Pseudorhodoplanes sp.]|uniref:response regulator transcription factor n=1 Tax=Pseudorhodoplanes sp. TaxID=1934341 RepID=UPI002C33913D|nr:response regulator [Pseudorhodoplanes sp.]HWV52794.1 response regulator [Pseudorhodoplanes sp.]